jgi:hypothetical protein
MDAGTARRRRKTRRAGIAVAELLIFNPRQAICAAWKIGQGSANLLLLRFHAKESLQPILLVSTPHAIRRSSLVKRRLRARLEQDSLQYLHGTSIRG